MTPYAQQGMQELNRQFVDERDLRGFQGPASPIENARGIATAKYLAQLQNDAMAKRMAAMGALQAGPGSLGLLGLGQHERIAGSPTAMQSQGQMTGTGTGTVMSRGGESQQGFNLGSLGGLLGGIGSLYSGYKYQPQGYGGGSSPTGGYGGGYNYSQMPSGF